MTRASATRTLRPGCSTPTPRPTSTRCRSGRYRNIEWYAQDNWKASRKLTLDYGVRFYLMTPQWDASLASSNFLPDQYNASPGGHAVPADLRRRRFPVLWLEPCGSRPHPPARRSRKRYIGSLTPDSNRFNGAFVAGQGIDEAAAGQERLQGVSPLRRRVRHLRKRHHHPPRGRGDLLRPRVWAHGLQPGRQRTERLELGCPVRAAAEPEQRVGRSQPDAVA